MGLRSGLDTEARGKNPLSILGIEAFYGNRLIISKYWLVTCFVCR
jgi:hypothetical protein